MGLIRHLLKNKRKAFSFIITVVFFASFSIVNSKAETVVAKYMHSWFFNESGKQKPNAVSEGKILFEYLGGNEGVYKALNEFQSDWAAWTMSKTPPSVASWYIGSTTNNDGVIAYTSNSTSDVKISSSVNIKIDDFMAKECDGVGLMVVQENSSGFYPLWPNTGKFEWANVKDKGEFKLPEIKASVKDKDRILFIIHSLGTPTGDTVVIDPVVEVLESKTHPYPTSFVKWPANGGGATDPPPQQPNDNETVFKHSAYYSSASASNVPFTYKGGYNGEYNLLNTYREDWSGWTYGGSPPTIGSYYMCGTVENDAVLVYTAQKAGLAKVGSEIPIKLQFGDQSDGSAVILVLKNENGEHPIWPKLGEWEYQPINSTANVEMKNISVYMRKGDELHFISRSTGTSDYDTIEIAPVIEMDFKAAATELLPNVERVFPTFEDFIAALPNVVDLKIDPPAGDSILDDNQNSGDNPNSVDNSQEKPGDNKKSNSKMIIIIVIVAGVLVVAAAIVTFILVKRKRKGGENKDEN